MSSLLAAAYHAPHPACGRDHKFNHQLQLIEANSTVNSPVSNQMSHHTSTTCCLGLRSLFVLFPIDGQCATQSEEHRMPPLAHLVSTVSHSINMPTLVTAVAARCWRRRPSSVLRSLLSCRAVRAKS
ncbi:hypothetical protein HRR83_000241 [Exophiala dermatitidis]|uniref:Uncharacterized protein n=1 Tax=Exophiala dermatitidis TaxID=5970 RepID=A0AAN6F3S5_EXODE|nr:hypothetical protein HRR73_002777 [Exophiala dermatitidis]KAJ4527488.1 hypothetical protein HRR74_000242 [Exophiala dermatitidis]KAJ4531058.1 hypothetical protein HRR76_008739 [Exophiala dermatitidis]KAJ4558225.1 hypothetical protein HRR77_000240 [Exophiala dermatitidis]KAJ4581740.1 hypothetical protein HRR79_000753 [Exophiala dermatitidis]